MASSKSIQETKNEDFTVRLMAEGELDEVLNIMLRVDGWFMTRKKLEMLFRTMENSIYVIIESKMYKLLGCLMVTPAHDYDVVIGKMAISTECRGKGLGSQLLRSVVGKCLESGKTVSLFSERDSFYEKIGFRKYHPPWAGYVFFLRPDKDLVGTYAKANPLEENIHISLYSESNHFDEVASYDAMAQGYENKVFMNILLSTGDAVIVAVNSNNKKIVGYATAAFTAVGKVLAICGLKADSDVIAFWLFRDLVQRFSDLSEVRLSSLSNNPFLKQFGITNRSKGPFTRMLIGDGDIAISDSKLYVPKGLDFTY